MPSKPGPMARSRGERSSQSAERWMQKLRDGDLSGPILPPDRYLQLRGEEPVQGNPRMTDEYRQRCVDAVGLTAGAEDPKRYDHFSEKADLDLL